MKKELIVFRKWQNLGLLNLSSFLLGFAVGKKKNKQIKPLFKNAFIVLKKDSGILYWQKSNFEKAVKQISKLLEKKPKFLVVEQKLIEKKVKEINKLTKKIFKLALNKKSDQELIKLLQQILKSYAEFVDLTTIPQICVLEYKNGLKKEMLLNKIGIFDVFVADVEKSVDQAVNLILKEISRRTFYSVQQLNFALPEEIKEIFRKKGLKRYELDERCNLSMILIDKKGKTKIIMGEKTKKYLK